MLPVFSGIMKEEKMIQIENLVKRYGTLVALDHLNLHIKEGEIFGLLAKRKREDDSDQLYAGSSEV